MLHDLAVRRGDSRAVVAPVAGSYGDALDGWNVRAIAVKLRVLVYNAVLRNETRYLRRHVATERKVVKASEVDRDVFRGEGGLAGHAYKKAVLLVNDESVRLKHGVPKEVASRTRVRIGLGRLRS
jgi:hypothetical protein